jgi:hypothetical protein
LAGVTGAVLLGQIFELPISNSVATGVIMSAAAFALHFAYGRAGAEKLALNGNPLSEHG